MSESPQEPHVRWIVGGRNVNCRLTPGVRCERCGHTMPLIYRHRCPNDAKESHD